MILKRRTAPLFLGAFTINLDTTARVRLPSEWRHHGLFELRLVAHPLWPCAQFVPGHGGVEESESAVVAEGFLLVNSQIREHLGNPGTVVLVGLGPGFGVFSLDGWTRQEACRLAATKKRG